jgi:PilZ domain
VTFVSTVVQFQIQGNTVAKSDGEQRRALRRRVLKAGLVAYNERHSTLSCTVRDISDTGARVRVDGSVSAPDTFELIIQIDGLEASCEVVWRNGSEVGVRFLGAPRMVAAKRQQVINPLLPVEKPTLRRKPKPA